MIRYYISCWQGVNSGAGGHYQSLRSLAGHIGQPFAITVLGDRAPLALQDMPGVEHLALPRWRLPFAPGLPGALPDLLHAFDAPSALYAARLSLRHGVPMVCTKPGGPKDRSRRRLWQNNIVFHQDDLTDFQARAQHGQQVWMIPQRVTAPPDPSPRPDPFQGVPKDHLRILCISRLAAEYRPKLMQAISLWQALIQSGRKSSLAIIGYPQDRSVAESLQRYIPEGLRLFTDKASCTKSAEYLAHCDIALGAGRSLMEAMSLGKYCFLPAPGEQLPLFLTPQNYKAAQESNFSGRGMGISGQDVAKGFAVFLTELQKTDYRVFCITAFNRDFRAETGAQRHREIYNGPLHPEQTSTFLRNAALNLKSGLRRHVGT